MQIYPAIDLKDGKCVRLRQGDMNQATIFNDKPYEQARIFSDAGFDWLHLVDLDGAFAGTSSNKNAVAEIINHNPNLNIQLGGGIRTVEHIQYWLDAGISRVILGTVAVKNPALVIEACKLFPGRIAVGIDSKNGKVAVEGWAESSDIDTITLARKFEGAGVVSIIHTDIAKDGMMQGANIKATSELAGEVDIPVILSGGVTNIDDIKQAIQANISGAIIGRALYEGAFDFKELALIK